MLSWGAWSSWRLHHGPVTQQLPGANKQPAPDATPGPVAGLLHRACTQAPAGLEVTLHVTQDLPELLRPGVQCGGWDRVHTLKVKCETKLPAQQLLAAFPAVRHLDIIGAQLEDGVLFTSPGAWRQLESLTHMRPWYASALDTRAEPAVAAALASLPNLKRFNLPFRPLMGITKQLTGLTCLAVWGRKGGDDGVSEGEIFALAARNPGLQYAELSPDFTASHLGARHLHCLLQGCPHITELHLPSSIITQAGLVLLLDHGTHITILTVDAFELTADRADRDCSWDTLNLQLQSQRVAPSLLQFAYLPLRGVQEITTQAHPDCYDRDTHDDHDWDWNFDDAQEQKLEHFKVPLATSNQMPLAQLSTLLEQAATNLAGCPAWQKAPTSTITILGPVNKGRQLLTALKPLGGPHIKELIIHPGSKEIDLGGSIIKAPASSLGNGVTKVHLSKVTISADFWGTFAQCFPTVESLDLSLDVEGANVWQLMLWCHTMHRPLTVSLNHTNPPLCKCECWGYGFACSCLQQMSDTLGQFGVPGVKFM